MIDDVIRYYLKKIFKIFKIKSISGNMIKISRDAELDFDDDISKSYLERISESIQERYSGHPVRFVYDSKISSDTLDFILKKINIDTETDSVIPGGKYHNRRDYIDLPSLNKKKLTNRNLKT